MFCNWASRCRLWVGPTAILGLAFVVWHKIVLAAIRFILGFKKKKKERKSNKVYILNFISHLVMEKMCLFWVLSNLHPV